MPALALVALASGACATARPHSAAPAEVEARPVSRPGPAPDGGARARSSAAPADPVRAVLSAAEAQVGEAEPALRGRPVPRDCALFVGALFAEAGVDLFAEGAGSGGVRAIYRYVQRRGRLRRGPPAPGDLVFFDNSYDRNRDGKLNDRLTHVGIVAEVRPDGTAYVIHSTNHGIAREPMNLLRPHTSAGEDGERINAVLRRRRSGEPSRLAHRHLMAELFAGFGSVLPSPGAAARGRAPGRTPRGRP